MNWTPSSDTRVRRSWPTWTSSEVRGSACRRGRSCSTRRGRLSEATATPEVVDESGAVALARSLRERLAVVSGTAATVLVAWLDDVIAPDT